MRHANPSKSALALALTALLIVFGSSVLVVGLPGLAREAPITAWEKLLAENPEAAEDTSISVLERRILQVLNPEQAEAYAAGQPPESTALPGGGTLAGFIDRTRRIEASGLLFKPLVPCRLLDTRRTGTEIREGDVVYLKVRGPRTDYSGHGGNAGGCGVPDLRGDVLRTNTARALMLSVEIDDATGMGGLEIWPAGGARRPGVGLLSYGEQPGNGPRQSLVVAMCDEESTTPCRLGDVALAVNQAAAHVVADIVGYFEPPWSALTATTTGRTTEDERLPEKSATVPYWEPGTIGGIYYSEGPVGIGTSTPESQLVVTSANTAGGDPNAAVTIDAQDNSVFSYALSLRARSGVGTADDLMVVRGDGKVGIGTKTPASNLHVNGRSRFEDDIVLADDTMIHGIGATSTTADGGIFYNAAKAGPNSIDDNPGYGAYLMHNVYWDGTQWIQPQGTMYSQLFTVGHHYSTSWWRADPSGTNRSPVGLKASMMLQRTTGNLGIGTTMPKSRLHVHDGALTVISDRAATSYNPRGSYDDDEVFRAVGTTSDYIISVQDGSGRVQHYWNARPSDETFLVSNEDAGMILFNPSGNTLFSLNLGEQGLAGDPINWTNKFTVKQDGNVGIGTADPLARLDVRSKVDDMQIRMSDYGGAENAQMGYFNRTGSNYFLLQQTAGNESNSFYIKYAGNAAHPVFQFDTNTNPGAMVITENGKVGIGKVDPDEALQVTGNLKLTGSILSDGDICIGNCN